VTDSNILDAVIDAVAQDGPVVPSNLPGLLSKYNLDESQVESLLDEAERRNRVLLVNGAYWVMRVGKYADDV
jgi:CO dehydrogenase/acetyl-CoA synthase alpha subunit